MTLQQKALEIAITQIGVQEQPHGSNKGPEVNEYLKSVDVPQGNSWCMAFIYWCFNQAAGKMSVKNSLFKTGSVMKQWEMRKVTFGVYNFPQPGDIFIQDHGKGLGHTGIVEAVHDESLDTIEGNTNDDGSREGYEVCRRKRARGKVVGYLRFV